MQPSLPVKILSILVFLGMLYGLYQLGKWFYLKLLPFDAGSLAMISLAIILLPFFGLIVSSGDGRVLFGSLTMMAMPIGAIGLIASAVWHWLL